MFRKVVSVDYVMDLIPNSSTVVISGFNLALTPEYLIIKLYEHYERFGRPKDLLVISDALPAVPNRGLDIVAKKLYECRDSSFLRGVLIPYPGFSPWLQKLIAEELVAYYAWPLGIVSWWLREVACGRPGIITRVGLGTFLDPRLRGGCMNELARKRRECTVELVVIGGNEYLLYRAPKPDVGFIRGTTADEVGNLSLEWEVALGTTLNIAQAVKARPKSGLVVAQVLRIAKPYSIRVRDVHVPGPLIDYVVVAPKEYHWQISSCDYDPRLSGELIPPKESVKPLELTYEKVIARRVLMEFIGLVKSLRRPIMVNLGVGIPAMIASVAAEEGVQELIHPTIESGPWGGTMLLHTDFGASVGPYAVIPLPDQFTNYEGGIIDCASLGFMQVDKEGNVNPSFIPGVVTGPGGFPVIAYGAPRIYFAGSFTAGKKVIRVDGTSKRLVIEKDGDVVKFVNKLYEVVYNARLGLMMGQEVKYVTERCVFRLGSEGLIIEEVAPGVDIDRDIIAKMEFKPVVSSDVKEMDRRLFNEGIMGLINDVKELLKPSSSYPSY
jgi:acyl CoA:acetate/3-ketoacid CoA transferase